MLVKEEPEQSTEVVHLNNTLKVLLTDKLEMESVAVIVIGVEELISVVSDDIIEIELVRLNQIGWGDTDQVKFVAKKEFKCTFSPQRNIPLVTEASKLKPILKAQTTLVKTSNLNKKNVSF